MDIDKIINTSISEMKIDPKPYIMFKDLSSFKNLEPSSNEFNKIKYALVKSGPFEKHGDSAIKFSVLGFEVVKDFDGDWYKYKKSLKPKKDIYKLISAITGILSLILVYMNFSINNKALILEKTIENNNTIIDSLQTEAKLKKEFTDSIIKRLSTHKEK